MPLSADYLDQPFQAAIDFFLEKLRMGTETWHDIWQSAHTKAFVVAGAMEQDLLLDLYQAILDGIRDGSTIEDFRKDFREIVERHGWAYKGAEGWRTAVIFNTNLATAYHTGHYEHMLDPDVVEARPYWRYVESSSRKQRQDHKQWYDLILPADDPWWATHAPPNGWGCKCGVVNMSAREVERFLEEKPFAKTEPPEEGTYIWEDPKTGEKHEIPEGIDPGWAYRPGAEEEPRV